MQYSYTQPYTPFATWKSPGIATWCEGATHNQEEFILRIMWSIEIIFCSVTITMKRFAHPRTHPYVARETAGINGNGGMQRNSLTLMIFSSNANYTPVLH